jgi:hypothetical protein
MPLQLKEELEGLQRIWQKKQDEKMFLRNWKGWYFTLDVEGGRRFYERHLTVMKTVESLWPLFLSVFKQRCRQFCASRDPLFKNILNEILRQEDFSIPPVSSWYRGSAEKPSYVSWTIELVATPTFQLEIAWEKNSRWYKMIPLLYGGETWIQQFLVTMEECFKEISSVRQEGIFSRMLSESEKGDIAWSISQTIRSNNNFYRDELAQKARQVFMQNIGNTGYSLPYNSRKTHQWILGSSGAGKTQLLQRMICDDIEHGRSVVVMDSQRDMIIEFRISNGYT